MTLPSPISSGARQLKQLIRPLYYAAHSTVFYFRALKILRDYDAHYREAQRRYATEGNGAELRIPSLSDVRVRRLAPAYNGNLVIVPDTYPSLIERLHHDVRVRLNRSVNCRFFPKLQTRELPEHTEDIPEVQDGDVIAVQLKESLDLDGLQELCAQVLPQIEQRVYGAHVIVDKVYVYRNLVSRREGEVSWTWHYDNHPVGIMKIMIYLTDVHEENGPFEYMRSRGTHEALYMSPRPLSGYGRISHSAARGYLSHRYESHKVTGPAGTMVLFDENVVHRANIATSGFRDAVMLQIRPATFPPASFIDPRWTGSFEHVDFNPDPYHLEPQQKLDMLSG